MRRVFIDAGYWMAVLDPSDHLHDKARDVAATLQNALFVTSEFVLIEVLNFFSGHGPETRRRVANSVRNLKVDPSLLVVPLSSRAFDSACELYHLYGDKAWSLVDCTSFELMTTLGLHEALTHDLHFRQMGFVPLLR